MKQFLVPCRIILRGHALVEASTAEYAIFKFDQGNFEFDHPAAEMIDWKRIGEPQVQE